MVGVLLVVQTILTILILITNVLHIIPILTTKGKITAVRVARVLPSAFLLLISVSIIPVEILHSNRLLDYGVVLSGGLEIFQVGTYLGISLLSVVTKLRTYRCQAHDLRVLVKKRSVLLPAIGIVFMMVISSLAVTLLVGASCKANATDSGSYQITVQLISYNIIGVIPTVTMYIVILSRARSYYKNLTEKMKYHPGFVSHVKQYRSVKISVLTFVSTFLTSWGLYTLVSLLSEYVVEPSVVKYLKTTKSFFKLAMYALFPVSEGLLREKNLNAIKTLFKNFIQCSSTSTRKQAKRKVKAAFEKAVTTKSGHKPKQSHDFTQSTVTTDETVDSTFSVLIHDPMEHVTAQLCVKRLKKSLSELQLSQDTSPIVTGNVSSYFSISPSESTDPSVYHTLSALDIYSTPYSLLLATRQTENYSADNVSTCDCDTAFSKSRLRKASISLTCLKKKSIGYFQTSPKMFHKSTKITRTSKSATELFIGRREEN